jgi:hypothetical protein
METSMTAAEERTPPVQEIPITGAVVDVLLALWIEDMPVPELVLGTPVGGSCAGVALEP